VTSGRRGVGLMPMETRRDVIVRTAVLADELGYEIFAVPEGWGLDSAPVLTEIALRTARIRLASGVLSVWGRTPATLVTAGSPRWWPGTACPAGRPSSASYAKPPHHTRDPSRSWPGLSLPPMKMPARPGASPQAAPPGT